jgi:hypothetical protein
MTSRTEITAPDYIVLANDGERERARLRVHQVNCLHLRRPVISAQKAGKTARVVMDLLFVDRETTRRVVTYAFTDHLITASEQAKGDWRETWYPGAYTVVEDVPVENAEPLARAFSVTYHQALGEHSEAIPQMPEMPNPAPSVTQAQLAIAAERGYAIVDGTAGGASVGSYAGDRLPLRYALRCRAEGRPIILIRCARPRRENLYVQLEATWPEGMLADFSGLVKELTAVANAHGMRTDTTPTNVGHGSMVGIRVGRV